MASRCSGPEGTRVILLKTHWPELISLKDKQPGNVILLCAWHVGKTHGCHRMSDSRRGWGETLEVGLREVDNEAEIRDGRSRLLGFRET